MASSNDRAAAYRTLGVKPAITASGPTTAYGGTKLRPEVHAAMNAASQVMVDMAELNDAAGDVIARHTGAEAGMVTSGSAGALVLQAAAVVAGADKAQMKRLPDTTGMKNEIIIHNLHRFPYDQCYTSVGAKLVGVGDFLRCLPWELESAINENTAAIAYLQAPFVAPYAMPLPEVAEIAHAHDLPVIVDAASMVPPRENLTKYIEQGADMVIFSGGKAIRGPQGTGILAGRKDLIEAARANGAPNQFIGRGMKVTKEEVVGLVEALNTFVTEDEDAENAAFREKSQRVVDALIEMPGLDVEVRHNKKDWLVPSAVIRFTDDWAGPSRESVLNGMQDGGDTKIFLHWLAGPDTLAVDPLNLDDDEVEVVISRLREELLRND